MSKPDVHKALYPVTLSSLGGMLLISCITWTAPLDRYLMPAFLMPAIYSGSFLVGLYRRKAIYFKLPAFLIVVVACVQFLVVNYMPYPISGPAVGLKSYLGLSLRGYRGEISNTNPEPIGATSGQEWVLSSIAKVDPGIPVWLNVLMNSRQFNAQSFVYLAKLQGSKVLPTTSRSWTILGDRSDFSPTKALYFQWYLLMEPEGRNVFYDRESARAFQQLRTFVKTSGHFSSGGK